VYDPYGAVIGQRSYGIHPPLKSGHRGLFAESLTVGTVGTPDPDLGDPIETASAWVDGRVLVPNERVVYHMRNRVYDPGPSGATAGRFIQRDPNASGAVLYGGGGVGGLGSHGAAPVAMVTGLDLAGHVGDGVNTYGYLRGRMRGAGDPSGLVVTDLVDTAVQVAVGGLRGGLGAMIGQYAMALEDNVDWATDWSQGDGAHSYQSSDWVMRSFADGMVQGAMEALDPTGGLLVDMLSGGEELVMAGGGAVGASATGKRALFAGRKMHGSRAHWRGMQDAWVAAKKAFKGRASQARSNQQLTLGGKYISNKRPDLQLEIDHGHGQKTLVIVEICESQSVAAAHAKWDIDVADIQRTNPGVSVKFRPMTPGRAKEVMKNPSLLLQDKLW
jgi:hypothetical protein